ncbi:MAG: hypothetical protein EZS28_039835, partial [Streblomastix strix]
MVAGIFMKHNPSDLVRTAAIFAHKINLIAQAYAPTLIIDAQPLGIDQIGLVGDHEVLIYTLVPNPLSKRLKNQRHSKIFCDEDKNNSYEYLPLCLVLNARIPTTQHFLFIKKCNSGVNSVFGGLHNNLFRKLYHSLEQLQQQQQSKDSEATFREFAEQSEAIKDIEIRNSNINDHYTDNKIGKEEIEDDALYAEDLDDDYYLHMSDGKQSIINIVDLSPKGSLQNLPSIPSFALFSSSGQVIRAIPTFFDRIPIKDQFLSIDLLQMQDMNFGEIWKKNRNKIINDYRNVEENAFRLTIIEQALREFIVTGRIARRPPLPLTDYLPPIYGIRSGRYFESTSIFGISPIPISAEATNLKNINFQNVMTAIQQFV